jgi:hypothetical protein
MNKNDLNTVLQIIKGIQPEETSQDALAIVCAEYAIADRIRKVADARFEQAKSELFRFTDVDLAIASAKHAAIETDMTANNNVSADGYLVTIRANRPISATDAKKMYNALLKAGMDRDILDAALNEATTQRAPACVVSVEITE